MSESELQLKGKGELAPGPSLSTASIRGQQGSGLFLESENRTKYYYDAFGRRRAKLSPDSKTDEFFYDLGHQMLSDRGNNTSTSEWPETDYIWLAGRPVAMVRAKFAVSLGNMTRQADGAGYCPRDEEQGLCGTYSIVTDYLGKPVLTLDTAGNTSGTSSYEAFGFANRREYRWGSPHNNMSDSTAIAPPMPPAGPGGFDGPLRVLTSRSQYGASTVTLAGNNENGLLNGDRAHTWTNWRYSSTNSWTVAWTPGSSSDYGIDIEAYELQAKQYGTWWAWTPLRFPGHYYDKETELNENWNRYFDPRTNRYLSPEPLLSDPWLVRSQLGSASVMPTYAYAGANPNYYIDPDGNLKGTWFLVMRLTGPFGVGFLVGLEVGQAAQSHMPGWWPCVDCPTNSLPGNVAPIGPRPAPLLLRNPTTNLTRRHPLEAVECRRARLAIVKRRV
ncbi:MAG: RHS repeat-associated core domain-containing protein [Archangium sp.]|nr:RHS repeat-associated core domain-containing protein [Archangium sp.]